MPNNAARMATHIMLVDETKPLVVEDWLRDKYIAASLTDKYHNEIGDSHALH